MTKTAFIWDFDGTLVESYEAIIEALELLYGKYQLPFDVDWVAHYIIEESTGKLLDNLAKAYHLNRDELKEYFSVEQRKRDHMITLMPHAKEALQFAQEKGIQNFIYTHKGATTGAVLERLGIERYFAEVLTSANGFARKPDPEGVNYLVAKYGLDKAQTYYIGDRKLDVEVAENAGIQSLNLNQSSSSINQKLTDLSEIQTLFSR